MVSMFVFDKDKEEMQKLVKQSKESFAYCSEEELHIVSASDPAKGEEVVQKKDLIDTAFFDVTSEKGLTLTRDFRQFYELSEILVIADMQISPMQYLTPDIRAASLLLRPFTEEQSKDTITKFFKAYCRGREVKNEEKKLVVENRQGKIAIPYSSIYYIEVREKKIYVRLKEKEYSKYETMENIIAELPEDFVRCHRSFVVNTNYINRIKLSENTIYLEDDIMVPLSRSYKSQLKEFMNQLKG